MQAWWAPIAAALAVSEVVAGIGIFLSGENWSGRIIGGLVVFVGLGLLALYGLWIRPIARHLRARRDGALVRNVLDGCASIGRLGGLGRCVHEWVQRPSNEHVAKAVGPFLGR
jgi:hypothetical protein